MNLTRVSPPLSTLRARAEEHLPGVAVAVVISIAAFAIAGMQDEAGHGRGDDLDVPGPGPEALRPAMELIGPLVRL